MMMMSTTEVEIDGKRFSWEEVEALLRFALKTQHERRLTREEWEETREEEWAEERRKGMERGDFLVGLGILGSDILRQTPEQLEALIEAKAEQARISLLEIALRWQEQQRAG